MASSLPTEHRQEIQLLECLRAFQMLSQKQWFRAIQSKNGKSEMGWPIVPHTGLDLDGDLAADGP
jgi:hypothetical protein